MIVDKLRHWARAHTRKRRYSPVGLAFHWGMAALVLFQMVWGWRTSRLPAGYEKLDAYVIHGQAGLLIFTLALLRIGWRMMVPGPLNDADKPGWQSTAAHLTHYCLYACFLGLPLSGWIMLSATAPELAQAAAHPAPSFLAPLGSLSPPQRWAVEMWSERVHFGLVIALLVLLPLHVAGAAKHHVLHRHDVLEGMLPGVTRLERTILKGLRRRPKRPRSPDPSTDARSPA